MIFILFFKSKMNIFVFLVETRTDCSLWSNTGSNNVFLVFKKSFLHKQLWEGSGGVVTHLLHSITNTAVLHSHAPPSIISSHHSNQQKNKQIGTFLQGTVPFSVPQQESGVRGLGESEPHVSVNSLTSGSPDG